MLSTFRDRSLRRRDTKRSTVETIDGGMFERAYGRYHLYPSGKRKLVASVISCFPALLDSSWRLVPHLSLLGSPLTHIKPPGQPPPATPLRLACARARLEDNAAVGNLAPTPREQVHAPAREPTAPLGPRRSAWWRWMTPPSTLLGGWWRADRKQSTMLHTSASPHQ